MNCELSVPHFLESEADELTLHGTKRQLPWSVNESNSKKMKVHTHDHMSELLNYLQLLQILNNDQPLQSAISFPMKAKFKGIVQVHASGKSGQQGKTVRSSALSTIRPTKLNKDRTFFVSVEGLLGNLQKDSYIVFSIEENIHFRWISEGGTTNINNCVIFPFPESRRTITCSARLNYLRKAGKPKEGVKLKIKIDLVMPGLTRNQWIELYSLEFAVGNETPISKERDEEKSKQLVTPFEIDYLNGSITATDDIYYEPAQSL